MRVLSEHDLHEKYILERDNQSFKNKVLSAQGTQKALLEMKSQESMRNTKSSFHAPFHSTSRSFFSPMSKQNMSGIFVRNTQVFRHLKEGGLMGDEEFEEKKKLVKENKLLA